MKNLKILSLALAALLLGASLSLARSGPEHRSFRALGMGNAFVAIVDDKEALYYNPAGLNLINSLGNRAARPGQANYPRNRMDARLNLVGTALPAAEMMDFFDFFKAHKSSFTGDSVQEHLLNDTGIISELTEWDRKPIRVGVLHSAEFAMHNFGVAYWADANVAPYIDAGIWFPDQGGIERIEIDAAFQVAGARSFLNEKLAVGVGYKLAKRQNVENFEVSAADLAENDGKAVIRQVMDSVREQMSELNDVGSYGHGLDVGALWQQNDWLRFGGAIQNLGMYLNGEPVTPEFTVGAAVTPPLLSSSGMFSRKVNIAVDFEDIFNNDRNYKLPSKINFGAEVEQNLWWIASVRGSGGFKGGYWAAGAGLSLFTAVHFEAATWAEEAGYYTGQQEDRYWAINFAVGI